MIGANITCGDVGFLLRITVKIVKYMHIIVPIILVIFISFDLFKVVVGQADDKAKKEASGKAVKRLIYAVIIFLIPTIINFLFNTISKFTTNNSGTTTTSTSWIHCWSQEYNK